MRLDPAAKRYARAAFELALEGDPEAWLRDLDQVAAIMTAADLQGYLENTRIREEERLALLARLLPDVGPLALNLACLLVRRGRVALAPQAIQEFRHLLDDHRGVSHAQVTTAVPLDDAGAAVSRRLAELTGKHVVVENRIDPQILGGVIVRMGDKLMDGSTRARLLALKRELEGGG